MYILILSSRKRETYGMKMRGGGVEEERRRALGRLRSLSLLTKHNKYKLSSLTEYLRLPDWEVIALSFNVCQTHF